jgi:hypothetical protein
VTNHTRDIRLGLAVVEGEGCDDPDCEDCFRALDGIRQMLADASPVKEERDGQ